MSFKVFGSDDDKINSYDLVALKLSSLNDDFEINVKCLKVPFICSPLTQGQAIDWAKKNYWRQLRPKRCLCGWVPMYVSIHLYLYVSS